MTDELPPTVDFEDPDLDWEGAYAWYRGKTYTGVIVEYHPVTREVVSETQIEKDKVQGGASLTEIHARSLRHRRVCVIAFDPEGRLLLAQNKADAEFEPSAWSSVAFGHTQGQDAALPTALRLIKERLGLEFDQHDLTYLTRIRTEARGKSGACLGMTTVYLAERKVPVSELPAEAIKAWVRLADINELETPGALGLSQEFATVFGFYQRTLELKRPT